LDWAGEKVKRRRRNKRQSRERGEGKYLEYSSTERGLNTPRIEGAWPHTLYPD